MANSHRELNLHFEILPQNTKKAFDYFVTKQWLASEGWYLAGGTALALHMGHRQSLDLDFFTKKKDFAPRDVIDHLSLTPWHSEVAQNKTVFGTLFDARVSFISYPYFLPAAKKIVYGKLPILAKEDIAVMKIMAISQRGRKRDFIDLFWYAQNFEKLEAVLSRLSAQYPSVAHDFHHVLKSLVFFDDAEHDPMPQIKVRITWREVKKYFIAEIKRISPAILRLRPV